jgi:hypothetical protein
MKLHRMQVRTSKASGKKFYRYDLTVPLKAMEALDWEAETPLEWHIQGDELVIRAKR